MTLPNRDEVTVSSKLAAESFCTVVTCTFFLGGFQTLDGLTV